MTKMKPFEIVRSALNGKQECFSREEIESAVMSLKEKLATIKAIYSDVDGLKDVEVSEYVENLLKSVRSRSNDLLKNAASLL